MPRTISSPRRSRRCSFKPWVTHRRRVNHQNMISVFTSPQIFLTLPGHISGSSMAMKILKALWYGQRTPQRSSMTMCHRLPTFVTDFARRSYFEHLLITIREGAPHKQAKAIFPDGSCRSFQITALLARTKKPESSPIPPTSPA